jgi:hypothetical protein
VARAPLDVAMADTDLDADAEEARVDAQAGGVNTEEVATLPSPLRYQLTSGSPKHSPIVTPFQPSLTIRSSM